MHQNIVKAGYNQVAEVYNQSRKDLKSTKYLSRFLELVKPNSFILDLGCGNAEPIDTALTAKGHSVIGIDISETQVRLARQNCPGGSFSVGDLLSLKPKQYNVDAVVSYYTIFHTPKSTHADTLAKINSFIPIGAPILISMGDRDWEGMHDFYGTKMYSSHYTPSTNRKIVEAAGFQILLDEIDTSGREKHQIIIAKKIKNVLWLNVLVLGFTSNNILFFEP